MDVIFETLFSNRSGEGTDEMDFENSSSVFKNGGTDEITFSTLVTWGIIDSILILATLAGNILTICAVKLSRKLSAVLSNQFIFSLALSDITVAVCFPYHYAFFLADILSETRELCLLRFVFTIFACSSSISNLLGIAMDRYIAIVYPLHYTRYMTKKVAVMIIISSWALALGVSCVPIFWNTWDENRQCTLHKVLHRDYVNFIITPMFSSVWISMFVVYVRIWKEATGHAKRLRNATSCQYGKTINDSKSVQVVLIILGCFSICWLPFFVIVIVINVNSALLYELTLRMAIANSCMNPLIYAWKNSNFRKIFWCLIRCKTPNGINCKSSFITNHVPSSRRNNTKKIDVFVIKESDIDIELHYNNIKDKDKCGSETGGSVETVSTSISSLPRT